MNTEYLSEFQGAYLEDSYFLGMVADGCDLRLKLLFALTVDHPAYAHPDAGEQHCYREGSITIRRPCEIEIRPKTPLVLKDPDGSLDFGSIELYCQGPNKYRVVTEWFETTFSTEQIVVEVA
jgi:hypothetical protein